MWGGENCPLCVQAKKKEKVLFVENLKTVLKPTKIWPALISPRLGHFKHQ